MTLSVPAGPLWSGLRRRARSARRAAREDRCPHRMAADPDQPPESRGGRPWTGSPLRADRAGVRPSAKMRHMRENQDLTRSFRQELLQLTPPAFSIPPSVGTWRSLVAHLHGVQGVASSNLAVPTNIYDGLPFRSWPRLWPTLIQPSPPALRYNLRYKQRFPCSITQRERHHAYRRSAPLSNESRAAGRDPDPAVPCVPERRRRSPTQSPTVRLASPIVCRLSKHPDTFGGTVVSRLSPPGHAVATLDEPASRPAPLCSQTSPGTGVRELASKVTLVPEQPLRCGYGCRTLDDERNQETRDASDEILCGHA
jgi:hypothetical protein